MYVPVVFWGGISHSFGQDVEAKAREYNFNIVYLSLPDPNRLDKEQPLNIKFFANEKPIHLSSIDGGMSRYFSHKGSPILYFYNENGTNEEGEIIYKPVLNVNLGVSGQKLIFVMAKPNGALGARVFNMDEATFPLGTAQLLNFSQVPVIARVGEGVHRVAPFKIKNFPIEIEKRRSAINFDLATEIDGQTEVVEMKRLAFTQNGRRLILVYNDPRSPARVRHRVFSIARPTFAENRSDEKLEAGDYERYLREYIAEGE